MGNKNTLLRILEFLIELINFFHGKDLKRFTFFVKLFDDGEKTQQLKTDNLCLRAFYSHWKQLCKYR